MASLNRQKYAIVAGQGTQQKITRYLQRVYVGEIAYATDTNELFIFNGSTWQKVPFTLVQDLAAPDMGSVQTSNRLGYNLDSLTDKTIAYSKVGNNDRTENGAIRYNNGYFQVYLNETWNNIVVNLVFREDLNFGYTLEHAPIGFTNYIEIMTGQTLNNLGLNGLPLTNSYKTVIGAYGVPSQIGGRTII